MDHRASKLVFGFYEIDYAILESKVLSSVMEVLMQADVGVYVSLDLRVSVIMLSWGSINAKMDVDVAAYLVEMVENAYLFNSASETMVKDY